MPSVASLARRRLTAQRRIDESAPALAVALGIDWIPAEKTKDRDLMVVRDLECLAGNLERSVIAVRGGSVKNEPVTPVIGAETEGAKAA